MCLSSYYELEATFTKDYVCDMVKLFIAFDYMPFFRYMGITDSACLLE